MTEMYLLDAIHTPNRKYKFTFHAFKNAVCLSLIILVFLMSPTTNVHGQNTLDNIGLTASTPSAAAFSLRKLSSSYTGKAIKVRRNSDNTLLDIDFLPSGDLDTIGLKTFVGSANGYVETWYDQSGNARNVTQATLANQPRIVLGGVIEYSGQRPAIYFAGSPQNLSNPFTSVTISYPVTVNVVANTKNATTNGAYVKFGNANGIGIGQGGTQFDNAGKNLIYLREAGTNGWCVSSPATTTGSSSFVTTGIQGSGSGTSQLFLNGASINLTNAGNAPSGTTVTGGLFVGGYSSRYIKAWETEVIVFASALTATTRQSLECNQISYYSVQTVLNQNAALCTGASLSLTPTAPAGTTYSWGAPVINPVGAITGFGTGSGQSTIAQTLTNTTVSPATATYVITPSPSCSGLPFTTTVTVNPIPSAPNQNLAICSGTAFAGTPTGLPTGTVYTWATPTISPAGAITGSSAQTNITTISQTLANTTTSPATATYVVTPKLGSCTGAAFTITVTVNPVPGAVAVNTAGTYCGNTSLTTTGGANGTVYFQNTTNNGTSTATPSTSQLIASSGTYYFRAQAAEGCWGTQGSAAITIRPIPTANITGGTTICQAGATNINIANPQNIATTVTYTINGGSPINLNLAANANTNLAVSTASVGSTTYQLTGIVYQTAPTCSNTLSGSAVVVINPKPTLTSVSQIGVACVGSGAVISLSGLLPNTTSTIGYKINGGGTQNATNVVADASGNATFTSAVGANGNSFQVVNVTITSASPNCSTAFALFTPAALAYNAVPTLTAATQSATLVCVGSGAVVNLTGLAVNSTSTVHYSINGIAQTPVTGVIASATGTASFTTATLLPENHGQVLQVTGITRTDLSSNCFKSFALNVTLTVSPFANKVVTANPATVCVLNGSFIKIDATSTKVKYQLRNDADNSLIGSALKGTGGTINLPIPIGYLTATTTFNVLATDTTIACSAQLVNKATVTVLNLPSPTVDINQDFCSLGNGNILLSADNSTFSSYLWSNDSTQQSIVINQSGFYSLTVTDGNGCRATQSVSIGDELVVNGNFDLGPNVGYVTDYIYTAVPNGLVSPGIGYYSISTNAQTTHSNFWGKDHTTQTGNFMIVNGDDNIRIWETTVNVQPNTRYYFSAWAMSLNNAAPYAQLRFNINGINSGTSPVLPSGVNNNSNNGWQRFYGQWDSYSVSGPITIKIVNLQAASGGNDFALDDISFSTLPPVTFFGLSLGNGGNGVCTNDTLQLTATLTGGAAPITYAWTGPNGFTSTVQNPMVLNATSLNAGTYTLVATEGRNCQSMGSIDIIVADPTISTASFVGVGVCQGTAASISISGLVPNSMNNTISYQIIGNGGVRTASGIVADATGNASFSTINLGTADNNRTLRILALNNGSCTVNTSIDVVLKVFASSNSGTTSAAPAPVCMPSNSTTISVSGITGSVIRWESSPTNFGVVTVIPNTTNSLTINDLNATRYYRVVVQNGTCGVAYGTVRSIAVNPHQWIGGASGNWHVASNWCGGIPTEATNVVIPASTTVTITGAPALVNNITLNGDLLVKNTVLKVAGTFFNGGGRVDASIGAVELNGTSPQTISGSYFTARQLKGLIISNIAGASISPGIGDTLKIIDSLSFGNVNNVTLTTGDNLVLVSDASGTARVADLTNGGSNSGNNIVGKVSVQRYFPAKRAWRLVTAPLFGTSSIFDTWQNGGVYTPGIGTLVTGPNPTVANGLDGSPLNNSSLKFGNNLTNITNTKTTMLSGNSGIGGDNKGYFLFVRGDRNPANTNVANFNSTTISALGNLQTGNQQLGAGSTANAYTLLGNPYASPVDINKANFQNLKRRLYVWDPNLNQVGGYVVLEDLANSGTFLPTPSGATMNQILQSGQAFFVETEATGAASLGFSESSKSSLTAPDPFRTANENIGTNLLLVNNNNNTQLADGAYAEFNNQFSASVDNDDAIKFGNINEMLAFQRNGQSLSVERRPSVQINDTLHLKLTKTTARKYRLQVNSAGLNKDNLAGYLDDKFTAIQSPLHMNGTTEVDFNINADPRSAVADRFKLVFVASSAFADVAATQMNADVLVNWNVTSSFNLKDYFIERSTNNQDFVGVGIMPALQNNNGPAAYQFVDKEPGTGVYYYRIRSTSHHGVAAVSPSVTVTLMKATPNLYVFPNPVTEGKINLQLNGLPKGRYQAKLVSAAGQTLLEKTFVHETVTGSATIVANRNWPKGWYVLNVTLPDGSSQSLRIELQ